MKYVAYYRVSTLKQENGISAQKNAVNNFIKSSKDNILVDTYEEKESGKNDNRVELNKALIKCKKENAILLIAKLDRLSRRVSFLFSLKDSGINFVALECPNLTTLTLGIYATIAQAEREMISQRTKAALQVLKQSGKKLGTPLKHVSDEVRNLAYNKKKQLADENPNNKLAKCLVEALIKNTNNLSEIARILNGNGYKTSRGGSFSAVQVKRLIDRYSINQTTKVK